MPLFCNAASTSEGKPESVNGTLTSESGQMRAGLTTLILEESATTMTCFPCHAIAYAKAASYVFQFC
jgi:hypothetical protein